MSSRAGRPDLADSGDEELGGLPTTSVEELLEIVAELSERVARLERATVLLLAEKNGDTLAADAENAPSAAYGEVAARPQNYVPPSQPEVAQAVSPELRQVLAPGAYAPRMVPQGGVDLSRVDFDLPAHQWGGEGNHDPGLVTPIQNSNYPNIRYIDEEEKPKPKRIGPPERALVRAAIEAYPHILETVCLFWGGRECDTYLSRLVIDTRGGRRGFQQEVMDELLLLAEVATIKSGIKPDFMPYDREKFL